MKDTRVKGKSEPWFEGNIMEVITLKEKLKERSLRTKLHVDHERFKEKLSTIKLAQLKIKNKKTKKPKKLWKVLKHRLAF